MAFAVEGFATVAQNYISRGVASNFYRKSPLMALLGLLTLGNQKKDSLEIGRPGSGEILTAGNVSPIERKRLGSVNSYLPRIQKFTTNNTKAMAVRDTFPRVANPTVNSHGQANQAAAKFNWVDVITPILIWHEDKVRAGKEGTAQGQALAMGQLIDEATEVAMQEHIDWFADAVWNGNPTSQTADLWDAPLGLLQMTDIANVYGNVDRTVEATWQSHKDTTFKPQNIKKIIDDANLAKEIRIKGNGVGIVLTNSTIYPQFKHQVLNGAGTVLQGGGDLPIKMAKLGVKQEVLQVDNVLITYDPGCPANTVVALDPTVIKFMVHPERNMTVSKFIDLSETGEGGKDADQAFIRTRFMLTNDNPFLSARYTAIGT